MQKDVLKFGENATIFIRRRQNAFCTVFHTGDFSYFDANLI